MQVVYKTPLIGLLSVKVSSYSHVLAYLVLQVILVKC